MKRVMALLSSPLWFCVIEGCEEQVQSTKLFLLLLQEWAPESKMPLSNHEAVGQNLPSLLQSCL